MKWSIGWAKMRNHPRIPPCQSSHAPTEEPVMNKLTPQISVVIPVLNEAGNIGPLVDEIETTLASRMKFEVIIVDDGSTDETADEIAILRRGRDWVRAVQHEITRGQSAAIRSGVRAAGARIVAVMDGDGQNDPADLPTLFAHLEMLPDVDMVVGRRVRRLDSRLRKLSSRIANSVRNFLLNDGIKDTGCGLKTFYREQFLDLPAFDHMHRFLPALVQRQGGTVHCVPVNHRPRVHGQSKYGVANRLWVGIADLLGVRWLHKRRI